MRKAAGWKRQDEGGGTDIKAWARGELDLEGGRWVGGAGRRVETRKKGVAGLEVEHQIASSREAFLGVVVIVVFAVVALCLRTRSTSRISKSNTNAKYQSSLHCIS